VETAAGLLLVAVDNDFISVMKVRTWSLLLKSPHCKDFSTFKYEYQSRYNSDVSLNDLKQLRNVVSLSVGNDANYIALTDLYVLAAQLYHVLYINGGSILFNNIERLYTQAFGKNIRLSEFNINSVDELYEQFDFLFFICGYKKSVLALNRNLAGELSHTWAKFTVLLHELQSIRWVSRFKFITSTTCQRNGHLPLYTR
jgi:hypothetical protein